MADQPRILQVVDPRSDELRRHVAALAAGLRDRQVETLVAGPLEKRFRDDLSHRGIRWVNLPLPESLVRREQATAATAIGRLVSNLTPALVHAHGFVAAVPAAACLSGISNGPAFVYSPHTPTAQTGDKSPARAQRAAQRKLLERSGGVIVSTQAEKAALAAQVKLRPAALERIAVVPPGVERRRSSGLFDAGEKRHSVGLRRDAAIVIAAAPLEEGAHLDDFIAVAEGVSRQVPSIEFAILGDGSRAAAFEDLVHKRGLFGSTVFLRNRHDGSDIISTCNVFVALCDDANGISHALDALARGIRVVAIDLPGLREVFGGTPAVPLVPLGDHEAIAAAVCVKLEEMSGTEESVRTEEGFVWGLRDVLASDEEYDLDAPGLGRKAQNEEEKTELDLLLERHSTDNMIRRTFDVYNRVLSG